MKPPSAPVIITEVAPRDGLQNESQTVPTAVKVALVEALAECGVQEVEMTGFVSPKWVPQLADAEEVAKQAVRRKGVVYSALVPNLKGMERALQSGLRKVSVFTSTSETFSQRNINCSLARSLQRFKKVVQLARAEQIVVRGYISTVFHCPYEGLMPIDVALEIAERFLELGVDELSFGDTTGRATPDRVRKFLNELLKRVDSDKIILHLHDTYGLAIANALTAYEEFGIFRFDASAGGLGGCPYAKGAGGNVATEDLAYALREAGATVGVDIPAIVKAISPIESYIGRGLSSHLSQVVRKAAQALGSETIDGERAKRRRGETGKRKKTLE